MPAAEGYGTAGSGRGLILTVQGAPGGTPIPISGSGSGGASQADDSAFTPNTDGFNPVGGEVDDAATDTVGEGNAGIARITPQRAFHVNLRDNSGNEVSVGGGTQYTEDAAAAANPVGTALNLVRDDARGGALTTADGDNVAARGTNAGELYVKHVDAVPVTDNAGSLTVDGTVAVSSVGGTVTVDSELTTADLDTGAGTDTRAVVGLVVAASGGGTLVSAANPLPVTGGGGGTEYTVNAAAPADPTGATFVMERDDALSALTEIEGDWTNPRANANGALWVAGNGTFTVDGSGVTQPVSGTVTANAGTGPFPVSDNGGSLTVDGTVGVSGTVTVDSELTTADLDTGAGTDTRAVVGLVRAESGGGTLVGSANPLPVDGSGVTQPVSGTVTANLAAGTNNIGDVDVLTLPALPAGTNNIGDVDVASIAAGDNNIGNVDVVTLPALASGTNLIGRTASSDETSTVYQGTTARTPAFAVIDAATSGNNTLVSAQGASNKIRVLQAFLVAAGTVNVRFESGADGTALTGQMNLVANTGFVLPYSPVGWFETAANTLLNLELSAAVSVDGALTYIVVT